MLEMAEAMMKANPKMDRETAMSAAKKKVEGMMSDTFYTVNAVTLAETDELTRVEVLRTGVLRDRGLKITKQMLADFVDHFKENTYGTELQVNLSHDRDGEAAGWIKGLSVEEDKLFADVEWTPLGEDKLKNKLFKFVSAEFADQFPHHQTGKMIKNVFVGLALTNVPALKGQAPVALSEVEANLLNQRMIKKLIETLKGRAVVSKDDKVLLKSLLSELSEEEAQEVAEEVAEVEAKPEEAPVEAPVEAPAEGVSTPEELTHKLTEQQTELKTLAEKNQKLTEKIERNELSETFDKTFALTEKKPVGLLAESKGKVVEFMLSLSEAQKGVFTTILSEVRAADLSVYGSTDTVILNEEGVVELAEKLFKAGTAKTILEAQKMATEQLTKK